MHCSTIASAVEEGEGAEALTEALADFLPPNVQHHVFEEAASSLLERLANPAKEQEEAPTWMAAQQPEGQCQGIPDRNEDRGHDEPHYPMPAHQHQQEVAQQMVATAAPAFNISAAEFRPQLTTAVSHHEVSHDGVSQHGVMHAGPPHQAEGNGGGWYVASAYDEQMGEEDGSWLEEYGYEDAASAFTVGSSWADCVEAGTEQHDAFLAVLAESFPFYSSAALADLLVQAQGSVSGTLGMLFSLENEVAGQRMVRAAALPAPDPGEEGPSFSASEFPCLGGSQQPAAGAQDGGSGPRAPSSLGGYAAKARVGAAAVPPRARDVPVAGRMGPRRAAGPAAAPIWKQAGEGIPRFDTGLAVAREYGALRAEAGDHARIRNALFQQATQASSMRLLGYCFLCGRGHSALRSVARA
jgi:hypothetical protein